MQHIGVFEKGIDAEAGDNARQLCDDVSRLLLRKRRSGSTAAQINTRVMDYVSVALQGKHIAEILLLIVEKQHWLEGNKIRRC